MASPMYIGASAIHTRYKPGKICSLCSEEIVVGSSFLTTGRRITVKSGHKVYVYSSLHKQCVGLWFDKMFDLRKEQPQREQKDYIRTLRQASVISPEQKVIRSKMLRQNRYLMKCMERALESSDRIRYDKAYKQMTELRKSFEDQTGAPFVVYNTTLRKKIIDAGPPPAAPKPYVSQLFPSRPITASPIEPKVVDISPDPELKAAEWKRFIESVESKKYSYPDPEADIQPAKNE